MKRSLTAAALLAALALPALAQDNPFAGFKGKIREGNWQYQMQMEAPPGMPAGMSLPPFTFNHCVTAQDVEKGGFSQKDGKMPEGCAVKNMKMTASGASWRMECTKDPKMTVDSDMTLKDNGFVIKQRMAMDQGGKPMTTNSTMTGRYLGPCSK